MYLKGGILDFLIFQSKNKGACYTRVNTVIVNEKFGKNMEGGGCGLFQGTVLMFVWKDREKP
jgi:hypothetical protein